MMTEDQSPLFVLAAGGTGGHLFPARALAQELLGRGARVMLVTDARGASLPLNLQVPLHQISARPLGKGLLSKGLSFAVMGWGAWQSLRLLGHQKVAAVAGFGGYPTVPLLYAASRKRIPILLHEQNAVLGRANRAMLPWAQALAVSFPHVEGIPSNNLTRLVRTGTPVAAAFITHRSDPFPAFTAEEPLRLLVLGGSLGAQVFSTVVPAALALLPAALRQRLLISQQCRREDLEQTRAAFAAAGVVAQTSPFFTDVPERMAAAHLVISRAGGASVAELTALGRPSILVPFPFGHAQEQQANAEALAQAGGAWIIPQDTFTPEALAVRLAALVDLPGSLNQAAMAARALGTTMAVDRLADCLYEVAKLETPAALVKKGMQDE
ncbi:MAG: undecaprenyldiphospho-muramoylpentapeptide beta-N-acetylglucosaminyltransferase [Alphaproteobacteria bacterium]|nr:undecaprenyldiphospho-muramoylpentapeptide beta-N-acetylglucosaminyltransferase [Alphaproteobacteria bacterium]